jgi:hydrogenase maturation protease
MRSLRSQIQMCLQGRVCVMGMGNVEHGDDGFGVHVTARLLAEGVPDVVVAETAPERYIGRTLEAGFDHLVFIDAVDFGGRPGEVVFLSAAETAARFPQVSTHKIPLGALAKWAESTGAMKAWLLGTQPASLQAGCQLSAAVQIAAEVVEDWLRELKAPRSAAVAGSRS